MKIGMFGSQQHGPAWARTPQLFFEDPPKDPPPTGDPNYKQMYEAATATIQNNQVDFDKRFTGLQQTYQKEKDAHTAAQGKVKELTGQIGEFSKTIETLTGEKTKLAESNTALTGDLGKTKSELERKALIMKDFPQLATFEANGLLPTAGEGENLAEKLKLFAGSIDQLSTEAGRKFKEGDTPPPPPPSDKKSSKDLLAEANAIALKGDPVAHDTAMQKYHEAKDAEQKAAAGK